MNESTEYGFSQHETETLQQLWQSITEFRTLVDSLPPDARSMEHNQQYNYLRTETRVLLKSEFTETIPKAITGDIGTDRSLMAVVILGVILALIGLGVNSIILEDVIINSMGCCVSSGGMLLIVAAFGILAMKNIRERMTDAATLSQNSTLLLHQIDHRLRIAGVSPYPQSPPPSPRFEAGPEGEELVNPEL